MHNLLFKMEAELNKIRSEYNKLPPIPRSSDDTARALELHAKTEKLRSLMKDYVVIQNRFLELTGSLSVNY